MVFESISRFSKDTKRNKLSILEFKSNPFSLNVKNGFCAGVVIVKDGNFKVSMMQSHIPIPIVDSLNINDIESQTTDDEKKIYTLNAVVNVGGTTLSEETSDPTDGKTYSSFVMQLTDSGIDVTITSKDPMLSVVAGKTINFTRDTGSTE